MKRNLSKLADKRYDLVIIGGGISGACVAWDASLRGLAVALVDKADFGAATSAASGKVIHGGLRYIQYGALKRARESSYERMIFQQIAPQFIREIPFLIPTYGHSLKGKELLSLGMTLYDFLSFKKNNAGGPAKEMPRHHVLTKRDTLALESGIIKKNLTGGVLYHECQMHNPERLTLSFLLAANGKGADLANYVKVFDFLRARNRVVGIKAQDVLSGDKFEVQAKLVVNASGPWIPSLLSSLKGVQQGASVQQSKGIHIVTHALTNNCALALATQHPHAGALVQRGGRHFFIIPWRNRSLIGTTCVPSRNCPDVKMVSEGDIQDFLEEINVAYPAAALRREDVTYFYGGIYPDDIKRNLEDGYQGARKDQVFDHSEVDHIDGLITISGVKYTTARKLAQRTVDLILHKFGYKAGQCLTDKVSIYGGNIEDFSSFLIREIATMNTQRLGKDTLTHLIRNYGSAYTEILNYTQTNSEWGVRLHPELPIIKAQIIHAIRQEMAVKLSDVIFRRTGLGTIGHPGKSTIRACAAIMAKELKWNADSIENELKEVEKVYIPA